MIKKYLSITFNLAVDSFEEDFNVESNDKLKNYILSTPIDYLNSNRYNIQNINIKIDKKPHDIKIDINKLSDQISAILLTWEYEGPNGKKYSYGKTLHLDSNAMRNYIELLIPNYRHDFVSKLKYTIIEEKIVDITNEELIKELYSNKTLVYKKELPSFSK